MMFLIPFMSFDELISFFEVLEIYLSLDGQIPKYTMYFLQLFLLRYVSTSTVELAYYLLFYIFAVLFYNLLISIFDQLLIVETRTNEKDHFMDHDRLKTCFLENYIRLDIQVRCCSKSGTLRTTNG